MRAIITTAVMLFAISAHAEVIEIHDYVPPKPPPSYNARKLPAYSDEAVLQDAWTRSWLLLDIDNQGKVQRFKFLKRPGYNLEAIAEREVWKMSFLPAHTKANVPMETEAIWLIEWPSQSWVMSYEGVTTAWPHPNWLTGVSPAVGVPCRGSGPSIDLMYRDCSKPDMARAEHETWIVRPRDSN
jgi:hypothetical protein